MRQPGEDHAATLPIVTGIWSHSHHFDHERIRLGAMPQGLRGLRVVSFESRRAREMAELIRTYGGEPIPAPSMREVPLTDPREDFAFGEVLRSGDCDIMILLTGVGTRMLIAGLSTRWPKDEILAALGRLQLVCREADCCAEGCRPHADAQRAGAEYLARVALGTGSQPARRG
jgi:hypothetical protein